MGILLVQPGNPNDFSEEELSELWQALAERLTDEVVRLDLRRETGGYGEFAYEVIELVELTGGLAGSAVAVATVVDWARRRLKRRRKADEGAKPQMVRLYGPDGSVLKEVPIDDTD